MYLPRALPTRPTSQLYGRAQPLGQPVMRIVNFSFDRPRRASSTSIWSMMPGRARSLSVIDRPHVGQATQAMLQRRTVEISSRQLDAVRRAECFPSRVRSCG